jgi:hypothetical protein
LHEACAAVLVVTQGWRKAVSNGAHDSGGVHRDSGDARYWADDWCNRPSLSEALDSGAQCWQGWARLCTACDTLGYSESLRSNKGFREVIWGIPDCDELDGDGSEVCHHSENSAKLVSFRIRGPVK